jgi:hypothetical protein
MLEVIQSLSAGMEFTHYAPAGASPGGASLVRLKVRNPSQFLRRVTIELGAIAWRKLSNLLIEYSIADLCTDAIMPQDLVRRFSYE